MLWVVAALLLAAGTAEAQTTIEYYGLDAVGSVRVIFDPAGAITARMDYGPFGQELVPSTGKQQQKYAGLFAEGEAGLDYAEARMYQSRTGRFSTTDPLYAGLFEPQGWNRYAYALNSPLVYTDASGRAVEGPRGTCFNSGYREEEYQFCAIWMLFYFGFGGDGGGYGYYDPPQGGKGVDGTKPTTTTTAEQPTQPPTVPPPPPVPPPNPPDPPSQAGTSFPSCRSQVKRGEGGFIAVQTVPGGLPGAGYIAWGSYMYDAGSNFGPWAATVTVNGRLNDAKTPPAQFYPPHGSISPKDTKPGDVVNIRVIHVFSDPSNKYLPDVAYGTLTCQVR
jgi:RHS repeat-associated protein